MTVKLKPVGASEIKDPKIVREVIAQIRKNRTPEEWGAIEEMRQKRADFLKRAMGK
jgi:hypothetical protein